MNWYQLQAVPPNQFTCWKCGNKVGSDRGWYTSQFSAPYVAIYVCPVCCSPNYFFKGIQHPGVPPGNDVRNVPQDVEALYKEARSAVAASAYTAAVLACRKLLMNVAVSKGANPNLRFVEYVEHLAAEGYIPPNGRSWVDHIRKKGNEATHEIQLMTIEDADELITFCEMLLKFVYEFPARVPS
jgi:hypothetical protein